MDDRGEIGKDSSTHNLTPRQKPSRATRSGLFVGLTFCTLLFMTSFFGAIFLMTPLISLLFINPVWYRKVSDLTLAFWLLFVVALLQEWIGVQIFISGDEFIAKEPSLIIMNHRTRLDWLFFWLFHFQKGSLATEKIILKTSLKGIVGAGWAMQVACFMFIKRKWEEDKKILSKLLDYFSNSGYKAQILLFPEGTDLNERSRAHSNSYAAKERLPFYNYTLHPRTTGFSFLAERMIHGNILTAVYDVCIGYPVTLYQQEIDVVCGDFPQEIHFRIDRHPVETLPSQIDALSEWCKALWAKKEARLEEFYQQKSFCLPYHQIQNTSTTLKVVIFAWIMLLFLFMLMLYESCIARWFFCIAIAFYLIAHHIFGGVEQIEIYMFNTFHKKLFYNRVLSN